MSLVLNLLSAAGGGNTEDNDLNRSAASATNHVQTL